MQVCTLSASSANPAISASCFPIFIFHNVLEINNDDDDNDNDTTSEQSKHRTDVEVSTGVESSQ